MSAIKAFFVALWEILTLRRWRQKDDGTSRFADTPSFQTFVVEWITFLKNNRSGVVLGQMFVEWLREDDEDAIPNPSRRAFSLFAAWMQARSWAAARKGLSPYLTPEAQEAFARPDARAFFEEFRLTVCENIRDYWANYLAERKATQEGQA
jgi:hypothetical protein